MKNQPKSFRLHPEIDRLIDELATHELTTRTGIIETAIKEMAKDRKVTTQNTSKATEGTK